MTCPSVATLIAALVALLALAPTPATACENDPACRAARLRAAGSQITAALRCQLHDPAAAPCQGAAFARLQRSLGNADRRLGCSVLDAAGEIADAVSGAIAGGPLTQLLGSPSGSSRCSRTRWTSVARFARARAQAQARAVLRPDGAVLTAALRRLEAQLGRGLEQAARFGDCNGGVGTTVAAVSRTVGRLLESTCTICGNGVRGGAEQCDGGDALCPGQCATDCTCPSGGYCGDGHVQAGEECDGTDAAACAAPGAVAQCGAPGRSDACRCSTLPVSPGACVATPPSCPGGQSCATLAILTPLPEPVHACLLPEPSQCTTADACPLAADACVGGGCCATLGGVCGAQNPCCDGSHCGPFDSGLVAICCRGPLEPCVRNEDCCQRLCESGPSGSYCAFF